MSAAHKRKDTPAKRRDILAFALGLPVKGLDQQRLIEVGLLCPWRCSGCSFSAKVAFGACPRCVVPEVLFLGEETQAPPPAPARPSPRIDAPVLTADGEQLVYRALAEAPLLADAVRAAARTEGQALQARRLAPPLVLAVQGVPQ